MSEQLINVIANSAVITGTLMIMTWIISMYLKDASVVDLIWGSGFVLISWTAFLTAADSDNWLLPVLTSIWGLRLSCYLAWRNHGQAEDYRYQAMRKRHGEAFPMVSLLTVFGLQGVIMWIVSLPLQAGAITIDSVLSGGTVLQESSAPLQWGSITTDSGWHWLRVPGVTLWAIGLFFETVGDWQLARFKANPDSSGQVLETGLWRFTRHPNYFGDFLVWWGLYFVAVSASGAWWTVIGPVVMSLFLMRISGVTLLEKTLKKTKPQYVDYISRTNAFFPGLPRGTHTS
ncbi:MAG: DUF1295 domain-containing protein [Fuerstiella sp.]|nr:DUF1295 domain-containing protein [Fuerstiella sp.]